MTHPHEKGVAVAAPFLMGSNSYELKKNFKKNYFPFYYFCIFAAVIIKRNEENKKNKKRTK